jgi:hypothetical protein
MLKPLATLLVIVISGAVLGGCTKCGFIWDDWRTTPKSCQSDIPKS